jgi:hypothetical protein
MGENIMKKIGLLSILFFLSFCLLLRATDQNIYSKDFLHKFEKLSGKQKKEIFNSLNKENRIKFVVEFMKGKVFDLPPVALVAFYSDGDFIADIEAEGGGMVGGNGIDKPFKYFIGKWYCKDSKIFFNSSDVHNKNFGKYSIVDDVKIDDFYEDRSSGEFVFHILEGQDFAGNNLANEETDLWGGISYIELKAIGDGASPSIDSYTTLKQAKSNKKKL